MASPRPCPRCGSDKIIPGVSLRDHYGDMGIRSDAVHAEVDGKPNALVFKDRATGDVQLAICGACGHVEVSVDNFEALYEKYRKSQEQ